MADVSERKRGQLILITGLAIAVTLVALVLLMNTVIYTENLATRGAAVGGQNAIEYQRALVEGVGGIVDEENQAEHDSQPAVEDSVTAGIRRLDELVANQHVQRGTVASLDVSSMSFVEGRLVRQTSESTFDSPGGAGNWTVADDVSALRRFEMTVDPTSEATDAESGFHVSLNGTSGDEWRAYVYEDGGNVAVAVENGTEDTPTRVCSASGSEVTIDLTAGTVGGEECPGLRWAKGVDAPYTVNYTHGGRARGTYNVTVQADGGVNFHSQLDEGAGSGSPYWVHAVYSATFDVHYKTVDLTYVNNDVRVAPGEPA